MRKWIFLVGLTTVFSWSVLADATPPPNEKTFFFLVDPSGTYLFTDSGPDSPWIDTAGPASALDLTALMQDPQVNLRAGDLIRLEAQGDLYFAVGLTGPEFPAPMVAVFEGPSGFLFPGPLGTVSPWVTTSTCIRHLPTDIPQDFYLPNSVPVFAQVPPNARRLLFSADDCYFADNTDPGHDYGVVLKVTIRRPPYVITKEVVSSTGSTGSDTNRLEIAPSIYGCRSLSRQIQNFDLRFKCVKFETGEVVEGCQMQWNLSPGAQNGGHDHGAPGSRPLGELNPAPSSLTAVPKEGLLVHYESPEVSGSATLSFQAKDPEGNAIEVAPTDIVVKNPVPLGRIVMNKLLFGIKSHPQGNYGSAEMRDRLNDLVSYYFANAAAKGLTFNQIPALQSQGATLPLGGPV